jgi:hypothetical protein
MNVIGMNLTEVRTSAQGPEFALGTVGRDDGSGYLYKYVQYDTGAGSVAAVAGNFCYYYTPTGGESTWSRNIVSSDLSDCTTNIGAGVLQAVIADGGYGWIQVTGYAVLTTALAAGADGNALTAVGATDGTLDVSALVSDYICAVAYDASAKKVFLTCPL